LAGLLALTIAAAAFIAMSAGPASAAILHPYQSQITEAGGSALGSPFGLAVDSGGNLYVADGAAAAPALDKFDSTNAPVTTWGTNGQITEANGSPFMRPYGLALDGSDDLWLADQLSGLVDKFEPGGTFLLQSSGEGRLSSFARGVAFSTAAERLFVADSGADTLSVLKPDGSFESEITSFPGGGSGCCFIYDAADNSAGATAGDIYVSGQGNVVARIDAGGTPAPFAATAPYIEGAALTGTPSGPFTAPTGLAVDSEGNLYVAQAGEVDEFAPSGIFLGRLTGTATGPGGAHVPFGEVTSVGIGAASGKLYVGDSVSHVVDVFGAGLVVPEVTIKPATAITTTSATLNGEVDPEGLAVEECFFDWGTTTGYGHLAPCVAPDAAELGTGTAPLAVHANATGLPSGATIHFRLAAKNANGTNDESGDQSFLTGASIDSTSASEVSATAALLETELNPHGLATTYHFEYDTTPYTEGGPSHGTATPTGSAGSGEADVLRSAQLQGLQPLTTYHFRVVATNSLGTSDGPDRTFTTQSPIAAALLPDDRGWEMVTPPNKHGAPLQPLTETGAVIQAAADGSAFTSVANGPLGPESQGSRSPQRSQFLSTRGPAGWSTSDISTPHEEISEIHVGSPSEYQFFSEDLSAGLVEPEGATPLSPQTTERTPYRREVDRTFVPLVVGCPAEPTPCPQNVREVANVPPGTHFGGREFPPGSGQWHEGVEFVAATPDTRHIVLESPQLLTSGFKSGFETNGRKNLYELTGDSLGLISILPNGEATSEAGLEVGLGLTASNTRGAISADGSRVVFQAVTGEGAKHLYLRDVRAGESIQLDATEVGVGGSDAPNFQIASVDGSRVFFTDSSRLTEDASPHGEDLYMCEIELASPELDCALTDLSVAVDSGESADVQGSLDGTVSAADASGTHVYFAADGVLTPEPNSRGEIAHPANCGSAGEADCNLYVADTETGKVSLVAVLSSHDDPDWKGLTSVIGLGNLTARSSPDGHWFTFMSTRPLTGYDNRDARSGQRDAEVFLFDAATGHLSCVSCNPTGARPQGVFDPPREFLPHLLVDKPSSWPERWLAASIPGWTSKQFGLALYQSRYLSNSGREFFNAADALVPADTNGVMDVYEFEPPGVGSCTTSTATYSPASGGCVSLVSSGTSSEESAFLDASENGNDVFFLTKSRLTTKDVDSAFDVYDASVGGGEPQVVKPPTCEGDACQQPAVPPNDSTPGSLTFNGAGNVKECPKGKAKKSGHCVKRKTKHSKKHKHPKGHKRSKSKAGR
jgi:hypothetical protein